MVLHLGRHRPISLHVPTAPSIRSVKALCNSKRTPAQRGPSDKVAADEPDAAEGASVQRDEGKQLSNMRMTNQQGESSSFSSMVPEDVIKEFEMKLEGDLKSVGATLVAGVGVISWWRGVWSLLDHYLVSSVLGDVMCIVVGLMIVLYVRFSGLKLANLFPPL